MRNAILDDNASQSSRYMAEHTLATALPSVLPGATIPIDGTVMTTDGVVGLIDEHAASMTDVAHARAALEDAIRKEHALRARVKAVTVRVRDYAKAMVGGSSTAYAALGFAQAAPRKPSSATLKLAVEKRLATRKQRMTMGARQRATIKGVLPPAPTAAATAPASPDRPDSRQPTTATAPAQPNTASTKGAP
jgi:hypothetical protein